MTREEFINAMLAYADTVEPRSSHAHVARAMAEGRNVYGGEPNALVRMAAELMLAAQKFK